MQIKMKSFLVWVMVSLFYLASGQELPAYRIFNSQGQVSSFGALAQEASERQIVLFGELHNNPISHWLQLELTHVLHAIKGQALVMGAEMFEADNQLLIDEYFSGLIAERNFRSEARLWNNFQTDIRPLLEFARENGLKFVATNIPRRYAALVHREGFEALEKLSTQARSYIAPLPVAYDEDLPGYKAMLEMSAMHGQTNPNFPKAQAIKDATMAHFIMKNFAPGNTFIHFHGTYHSNNYEGIVWYLQQTDSKPTLLTIATAEQQNVDALDESNIGIADFIIVVPQRMTKTH